MKFKLLILFGILISETLLAQEKKINQKLISTEIKAFIAKNFQAINKIKYYQEKQNDSIFIEAEFHVGKDEITLKFFNNQLVEKETELEFNEISEVIQKNILNYLQTEYTKYKITECNFVETPNKNNQFEIYVKGAKNNQSNYYEIYFDEKGNFIKKVELEISPIQTQN